MDLLDKIWSAGIIGAGGAGFPTSKKLVRNAEWLIINAVECEPLLSTDNYIFSTYPDQLIQTLDLLKETFNVENVVFGIKKKHTKEIENLQKIIKERNSSVKLFLLDNIYPNGDEQILVFEITGKTVKPGGIPLEIGVVVLNVTTLYNIYNANLDIPVTKKVITVNGEVKNPILLDVAVGTSVADCIEAASGVTIDDYIFIMGGPIMGKVYTKDQIHNRCISKVDGGIIVLNKDHYLHSFDELSLSTIYRRAKSACIQCSLCTDMCPRFLIGHMIRPHKVMRSVSTETEADTLLDSLLCCECGICELYACPMGLSPRKVNIHVKKMLREKNIKVVDKTIYTDNIKMRQGRLIPQERMIYRLNLAKYPKKLYSIINLHSNKVQISLKQGIGKMATPTVLVGDYVHEYDCIGEVGREDVASRVHASIDGIVKYVGDYILIEEKQV